MRLLGPPWPEQTPGRPPLWLHSPSLHWTMLAWAAAQDGREPEGLVFASGRGAKMAATNVRRRVLAPAVERANKRLRKDELPPLPEGLTPHSLRRTFASVLIDCGENPAYVMAQLGHTSPNLTLSLYARAMQRRDGEQERLRALVRGTDRAVTGSSADAAASEPPSGDAAERAVSAD